MKQAINLVGRKFGRLTVISEADRDKNGIRKWLCSCECGNEKVVYQQALCRSSTKSCGCYLAESTRNRMSEGYNSIFTKEYLIQEHKEKGRSLREIVKEHGCTVSCIVQYMKKFGIEANDPFYNLSGQKIEMLEIFDLAYTKDGASYWNVKCDCGTTKIVKGASLVRRSIVSCGCWNKQKNWEGIGDLSKSYWSTIVKGAMKRKIEISISIEDVWDKFQKQQGKCALSGVEIKLDPGISWQRTKHRTTIQTASLDRIDSSRGYIEGNIQWVHKKINFLKMNLDEKELLQWCYLIVNHSIKLN